MEPVIEHGFQTREGVWIQLDMMRQPIYGDPTHPSIGRRYHDDDQGREVVCLYDEEKDGLSH
jgi:hypothetical protein